MRIFPAKPGGAKPNPGCRVDMVRWGCWLFSRARHVLEAYSRCLFLDGPAEPFGFMEQLRMEVRDGCPVGVLGRGFQATGGVSQGCAAGAQGEAFQGMGLGLEGLQVVLSQVSRKRRHLGRRWAEGTRPFPTCAAHGLPPVRPCPASSHPYRTRSYLCVLFSSAVDLGQAATSDELWWFTFAADLRTLISCCSKYRHAFGLLFSRRIQCIQNA